MAPTARYSTLQSDRSKDVKVEDDKNNSKCPKMSTTQIITASLMGMMFGFALEKGRVFEPKVIQDQMKFKDFTMMKMFLSAVATSQIVFTFLSYSRPAVVRQLQLNYRSTKPFRQVAAGGFMLGLGMSLAGACPGTLAAQLGTFVKSAPYAMVGAFIGAFLFVLVEKRLPGSIANQGEKKSGEAAFLNDAVKSSFGVVSFVMASAMIIFVVGLEYIFPSKSEPLSELTVWSKAFPPYIAGILIGSLQLPASMIMSGAIGSSTCYMVITHSFVENMLPSTLSGFIITPIKKWWQVIYLSSAILGAYLSASLSGSLGHASAVENKALAVVGGVLLVFGSRVAGGCTS
ncbi:hypothetical protein BKA69DRAFT_1089340 [Paraphysoderma sedebokerense]|nr:hypothetical protein BKA69DRAFT_1089340 [Paraphysoderma sedebokerense]